MKSIELTKGVEIPIVGLGVFKSEDGSETENAIKWAFECGYRHIDTAVAYKNEKSVGNAIKNSGLDRKDIFLTTKLWNDDIRAGRSEEAFYESLERLQTDYLDLYLIHWPVDGFSKAWSVIEKLYNEKKIRSIGVSNFHKSHLDELAKTMTIKPMINQIESNPYFVNQELIDYCFSQGIAPQAWSPIGRGNADLFAEPVLTKLAEKYNKSVVQIMVRWHVQRNVIVLPKSVNKERIIANKEVFDFELTAEELQSISALNKDQRSGPNPDTFDF